MKKECVIQAWKTFLHFSCSVIWVTKPEQGHSDQERKELESSILVLKLLYKWVTSQNIFPVIHYREYSKNEFSTQAFLNLFVPNYRQYEAFTYQ